MKIFAVMCAAIFMATSQLQAGDKLDLKNITDGKYAAERIREIIPLEDNDSYAQISSDGKKILKLSFKTGKETSVLFDVNSTVGEKIDAFDDYEISPDGKTILIQTNTKRIYRRSFTSDYYVYRMKGKSLKRLSSNGQQQTPIWSPDNKHVAFVRKNNIFIVDIEHPNDEVKVTTDGKFNEIINGIPDWVNEEEFSFNTAMTFNADGTKICWIRYDESKVPVYSLQLFKGSYPEKDEYDKYPGLYSYKYPKAGQTNSSVSSYYYDLKSSQTHKIELPLDSDGYIPRIKPTDDASKVILFTMNRHQNHLNIYSADLRNGSCRLLIDENVPKYVDDGVIENVKITSKHILLPSDRDGYMNLYLYDMNGNLLRQVTKGKHTVTDVYAYDETTGDTYYQAEGIDAMNSEVYVSKNNGKCESLSKEKGTNSAVFSKNMEYYINMWSDCNTPYVYTLCDNKGNTLCTLLDNKKLKEQLVACHLSPKEFFTFKTSEGVELNGCMIKPVDFDSTKKYPVIMYQYSGPGNQQVVNSWNIGSMGQGGMYDEYLVQKGFVVVCVDGRGTGGRGADFEKCTYMKLGELESKDQVETALYLGTLPYVDSKRIGIWGWSYGGFNTLMSMSEGRHVFRAGVAVAPPTNWKFYDSIYTERYMRTPAENKNGYDINPINRVNELYGALLICHGMADDNVHPQNTAEYTEALVQADKDFKENIYTNRNHSIYGGNTRNHLLRQIATFFIEELHN